MNPTLFWTNDLSAFKLFSFDCARAFFETKSWTPRQQCKGYKFFIERYLHKIETCGLKVRAQCYRSQKKNMKPHSLSMTLSSDEQELRILNAHCTCEAGNSQSCNHLVGLAFELQDLIFRGVQRVPEDVSCTSKTMEWNKPRSKKIEPQKVSNMTFFNPLKLKRKRPPIQTMFEKPMRCAGMEKVTSKEVQELKLSINEIERDVPVSYLLTETDDNLPFVLLEDGIMVPEGSLGHLQLMDPEPSPVKSTIDLCSQTPRSIQLPILCTEHSNILLSLPPIHCSFFTEVTFNEASDIEERTREQSASVLWHEQRKHRFTASMFGEIYKRKIFNDSFIRTILNPHDLSHLPSIQHGKKYESQAIDLYLKSSDNQYFSCGLVIHPYAVHLGASPDGIIYDEPYGYGVLEVKCPHGKKYANLSEFSKIKGNCLRSNENDFSIDKNHNYYYQIQGQMLLTGLNWGDFVIYLAKSSELLIERINFDPKFCFEMYVKLTNIYEKYFKK